MSVLSEQDPLMIFNEREQALYLEHFRETNYVAQLLLHHNAKEPSPEVTTFFDGLSSGTILCFTFDLARSHPGTFFIENLACQRRRSFSIITSAKQPILSSRNNSESVQCVNLV